MGAKFSVNKFGINIHLKTRHEYGRGGGIWMVKVLYTRGGVDFFFFTNE